MRKIPATMATQHPDNATAPFWDTTTPLISVHKEINEAISNWQDLGIDECMWDWEGKHADAAIIDRLFSNHYDYFKDHQLGRDKFLTFRIPNVWEEKGYNLMQAMASMLSAEDFSRDLQFANRPLFEAILPMTERAKQLFSMQQLFQKLAAFKSANFTPEEATNNDYLEMIPLVESVESQHGVAGLLHEYVALHQKHFGRKPAYIRTFLACSDPAIGAGHLATVLANKIAISDLHHFAAQTGIKIFPIAGAGSLPFRGGLSPLTIDRYIAEFPGIRTVTLQSSFRFDHPKAKVIKAIKKLEAVLPTAEPLNYSEKTRDLLLTISDKSQQYYETTLHGITADMQPYFSAFPKRRDRRQHIGLLAYGRVLGEHKLPRAITFTGSFYSIGVPPELIGLGRALRDLTDEQLAVLQKEYPHLTEDLKFAGGYLNKANLAKLAVRNKAWASVQEDVANIEKILNITLGPKIVSQRTHANLAGYGMEVTSDATTLAILINQMALLRNSLG